MLFFKAFSSRSSSPSNSTHSPSSAGKPPASSSQDDGEYVVVSKSAKRDTRVRPQRRQSISQDLRIMQYHLVLATGLMQELNTPEILSRNCYFGRYGIVEKVIISSKHDSFAVKNKNVQAFVTYHNQLDTAFAIAAIRDLQHHHFHAVKVHYGTSRYCPQFIQGKQCQHRSCYFNHQIRDHHLHKDALLATLDGQYQRVYKLIAERLEYFVEKQYQQFKNRGKMEKEVYCNCWRQTQPISFPTCKEVIQNLITLGIIEQSAYDTVKAKIKGRNMAQRQRCTSLQMQNKQNERKKQCEKIEDDSSKMLDKSSLSTRNGDQLIKVSTQLKKPAQKDDRGKDMPRNENDWRRKRSRKTSQTLEEYIENNIINESSSSTSYMNSLSNKLQERIQEYSPFREKKVGDLVTYTSCYVNGLNPQMDVSDYVATKIMKKTFVGYKFSRFDFAGKLDGKIQAHEERKLRYIIGSKLINEQ